MVFTVNTGGFNGYGYLIVACQYNGSVLVPDFQLGLVVKKLDRVELLQRGHCTQFSVGFHVYFRGRGVDSVPPAPPQIETNEEPAPKPRDIEFENNLEPEPKNKIEKFPLVRVETISLPIRRTCCILRRIITLCAIARGRLLGVHDLRNNSIMHT